MTLTSGPENRQPSAATGIPNTAAPSAIGKARATIRRGAARASSAIRWARVTSFREVHEAQ